MITRVATIAFLAAVALASLITERTNPRHRLYCDNLPGVRAGTGVSSTNLKPRDQLGHVRKPLDLLQPLSIEDTSTFCEHQISFKVDIFFNRANSGVESFLNTCLDAIQRSINEGASGNIPEDGWRGPLGPNYLSMVVWSEEDYQTTYEDVLMAIQELIAWMSDRRHRFGTCGFTIRARNHQVGHGSVTDGM